MFRTGLIWLYSHTKTHSWDLTPICAILIHSNHLNQSIRAVFNVFHFEGFTPWRQPNSGDRTRFREHRSWNMSEKEERRESVVTGRGRCRMERRWGLGAVGDARNDTDLLESMLRRRRRHDRRKWFPKYSRWQDQVPAHTITPNNIMQEKKNQLKEKKKKKKKSSGCKRESNFYIQSLCSNKCFSVMAMC